MVYRCLSMMYWSFMVHCSSVYNWGFVVNWSLVMHWYFSVMSWCGNMWSFMMNGSSSMCNLVVNWSSNNMRCLVMGSNSLMMSRRFMQLSSDELFVKIFWNFDILVAILDYFMRWSGSLMMNRSGSMWS